MSNYRTQNFGQVYSKVPTYEDRSQMRCGRIPQVMAVLRILIVGLMGWSGETNFATAGRRSAVQPESPLALINIKMEN